MSRPGLHPESIGPYAISGVIAEGGMSLVLAGRDPNGEAVAIKLAEILDERGRERFRREIDACRRLAHPGIIRIRAAGEYLGRPWYAMDYHGEVTLRELIECNGPGVANELPALIGAIQGREIFPLPPDRRRLLPRSAAVELVMRIVEAVAHAHARGLVHRDLKPENVLLQPSGQPVVVDFGLVAELEGGRRLTQTSKVVGTMGYLAPEQFDARRVADERVDVYAMGVILRELLTGHSPDAPTGRSSGTVALTFRTSTRLQRDPGDRPLDRQLAMVLYRATHPDPRRRYRSLPAFLADLQRVQRGEPVLARPDPLWRRVLDRMQRRRVAMAAAVGLGCAALIGGVILTLVLRWRIQDLAWAHWTDHLDLAQAQDVAAMEAIGGSWRLVGDGVVPVAAGAALAIRGEQGPDLRLLARLTSGPRPAAVGLFAAAPAGDPTAGYLLRIGADGAGPSELRRGDQLLALSSYQLPAQRELELQWELSGGHHRVWVAGTILFELQDPQPLPGGLCGIHAPSAATPGLRWSTLELRPASARATADPRRELQRLAGTAERLTRSERTLLAPAVSEAVAAIGDDPEAVPAIVHALRLVAADPAATAAERLARLEAVPDAQRDLAWERARSREGWAGSDTPARLLAAHAAHWQKESSRDDTALWLLRLAGELGDPRPVLAALDWGRREPASPLVAQAVDAQAFASLRWDGAARSRALTRLRARGGDAAARRSAAWSWWLQRVIGGSSAIDAVPPEPALQARLQRRWALAFGHPPVPAGHPVPDRLQALVLGRDPAVRYDPDLRRDAELLGPVDRRFLGLVARGQRVEDAAWDCAACSEAAVAAAIRDCLEQGGDWQPVAVAAAEAGHVAWDLPWHRLLVPALLVQDRPQLRLAAALSLGEQDLDAFAAGVVYRLATGGTLPAAELAAAGGGVRQVLLALQAETAPDPQLQAPDWHPSRPLLELALAWKARLAGDRDQAHQRLTRLAARPHWPEGLVARALLERPAEKHD